MTSKKNVKYFIIIFFRFCIIVILNQVDPTIPYVEPTKNLNIKMNIQ